MEKLIFVYNANAGKLNALLDSGHKIVSPSTYSCNICDLTHGIFTERKEWVRFRESVKTPLLFLHKDEFLKDYASKWMPKYEFPIILSESNGELQVAISTEECQKLEDLPALITAVKKVIGE